MEKKCTGWLTDVETTDGIGVGKGHRAAKIEVTIEPRSGRRQRSPKSQRRPAVGWQPQGPEVYGAILDEALKEVAEERAGETDPGSLLERCERIENAVTDVATKCQKREEEEGVETTEGHDG